MKWEYLREEEFEAAIERSGGLCVLPIGCMEKHGQHLPVGCDSIHARGLVELAAEQEDVVIFPTAMWLGEVTGYHALQGELPKLHRNRGGIGLKTSTLLLLLEELCGNGKDQILGLDPEMKQIYALTVRDGLIQKELLRHEALPQGMSVRFFNLSEDSYLLDYPQADLIYLLRFLPTE